MAEFKIKSIDVSDTLNKTSYIINAHGPRLPGTEACIRAAGELKKELKKYCDKVFENNFTLHPGSFFNIARVMVFTYFLGVFFYFFTGLTYLSVICFTAGLIYFVSHFVLFSSTFDGLFKKKPGKNVLGIIEPGSKLKQQIIISSHHDSPYICNFLMENQKLYAFRFLIPLIIYLYVFITSSASWITNNRILNPTYHIISLIVICLGCLMMIPVYWINSRKGSPGAGDNLVSSIIGIKIAEIIKSNFNSLAHTRIIILSNDGEEIGMKGVQEFIKQNKNLLNECKTYAINLDSLYRYEDLALLTTDCNGTVPLSDKLADEIVDVTNKLGYSIKKKKIPFGGGGTDAMYFAKEGIESASLIGLSTRLVRDGLLYHTAHDIVENLDPKAIEAAINIALNFVIYKNNNVQQAVA